MNNLSRREFLKFGAGALAFLKELSLPKSALAKLEELLGKREFIKESFEEGIERLKQEVYENRNERFFVFVKKGEISGWLNIEDKMSLDMGFSIDLLPILEDDKIEELHFVHTHSLTIVEIDQLLPPAVLEKIKKEKRSNFPLLPSAADMAALAKQKRFLLEKKLPQKLINSALDPAGIWTYDVDLNHPEIQKISKSKEPLKEGETRPDDDFLTPSPEESVLFRMGMEILNRQEIFYKNGEGINPKNLKELQNWYKTKYGATVTFTPHNENK